jgi:transcriptional regulator with XRE-family HTH domain
MSMTSSLKHIKNIGRKLRDVRESQGHNLAILARQCDLSVVLLTAIERGDSLAFARAQSSIEIAKVLGVQLEQGGDQGSIDDGVYIPQFLRKKEGA